MTSDTESEAPILEQASHWWELLHSESVSSTDHREFGDWVARSPERVAAYLHTARLVKALKSPRLAWPNTPAEELICEAKASRETILAFSTSRVTAPVDQAKRRSHRGFSWAMAAMLLVGIGLSLFVLQRPREFKTELGEQRSVFTGGRFAGDAQYRLDDRSRSAQGRIAAYASYEGRRCSRWYTMRLDPSRYVHTGNALSLTDVGTQFPNVDMRSNETTVTVIRGEVAVDSASPGGAAGGRAELGGTRWEARVSDSRSQRPYRHHTLRFWCSTARYQCCAHPGLAPAPADVRSSSVERGRRGVQSLQQGAIDIDSVELKGTESELGFRGEVIQHPFSKLFYRAFPVSRFVKKSDGDRIVTIRNGANHPETGVHHN